VTRDWLTLDDGETVAWDGRPRLTTALPGIGIGVALVVGALGVGVVRGVLLLAVPVALVGCLVIGGAYLRVVNTEYVVTDRAVYAKRGIVGRSVTEASLSKVQNSAFSQDALGAVFGYGTVTFEIAGGNDVSFRRIDDPETVRRLVDRTAGEEIPGSVEQWRAVLEEVRALRGAVESSVQ